jgi:hypothetical protein
MKNQNYSVKHNKTFFIHPSNHLHISMPIPNILNFLQS